MPLESISQFWHYCCREKQHCLAGPQRIAGYEDIIDDAARELERVNERLAIATMQCQRMQARMAQLEARATPFEDNSWQVRGNAGWTMEMILLTSPRYENGLQA